METSNQPLFIILLAVPTVVLFVWTLFQQKTISRLRKNQKVFFEGKQARNLESIILENNKSIQGTRKDIKELYEMVGKVHDLAKKGIHKVGMVRFNPFRDIGGDQSFSIALLDGQDNGITISSLYSREGVRIYSKSIQSGQAIKHQLTEEEKHAIKIASPIKKNNFKQKRNV